MVGKSGSVSRPLMGGDNILAGLVTLGVGERRVLAARLQVEGKILAPVVVDVEYIVPGSVRPTNDALARRVLDPGMLVPVEVLAVERV